MLEFPRSVGKRRRQNGATYQIIACFQPTCIGELFGSSVISAGELELLAGEVCQQLPNLAFTTAKPKEPNFSLADLHRALQEDIA
jgi:hypothetical protein